MIYKLPFLILLFILFTANSAELEIGGLLLDNTISRQGKEFSYRFGQLWQDLPNSERINVHIKEVVIPRSGTKLIVNMNNRPIYIAYLGRRQESIQNKVEQAIFILIEMMAQSQFNENNPDIADNGW